MPSRTVHHMDAMPWLAEQGVIEGASIVTSLPDVSGMPALGLSGWRSWFINAAEAVLRATPDDGVAIFYQTDIKVDGVWIDKAFLCQLAAEREGSSLLFHKVVCRMPAGKISFGRPAYTHMLAFSRGIRDDVAKSTQDVLPATGQMTWSQAMGVDACVAACRYILSHTQSRTVVDPFCGKGTVLAVANSLGLDAVGVELCRRRAQHARRLEVVL